MGMLYGSYRAQKTIETHPNHQHLLKVLKEVMNNRRINAGSSAPVGTAPDTDENQLWSSDRHRPSASSSESSKDQFDEDALLTDEEINRKSQGGCDLIIRC